MRKAFGFALLVLCAGLLYAATVEQRLRVSGTDDTPGGYLLVMDSAHCRADSNRTDTTHSDIMDISGANRIGIYYNLGTVAICDSCNDSVWVRWITQVKTTGAKSWRTIYRDSAGGNNITTLDDTTVFRSLYADSLCAQQLRVRTIVAERTITTAWGVNTYIDTSVIPINIDVAYRE